MKHQLGPNLCFWPSPLDFHDCWRRSSQYSFNEYGEQVPFLFMEYLNDVSIISQLIHLEYRSFGIPKKMPKSVFQPGWGCVS